MTSRSPRTLLAGVLAVVTSSVLLGVAVAPANAVTGVPEPETLQLMSQTADGNWVPVAPSPFELNNPDEPSSGGGDGTVTPYLIGFDKWAQCFTLNQAGTVFATYTWLNDAGKPIPITLQCGNDAYGYKHMLKGKKDVSWGNVLKAARAKGWESENYRVNTWDDLMNITTANLIGVPGDYYDKSKVSNKACTNGAYALWSTVTHKKVHEFRVEVVWSMNNKRVITAYPSSRSYCNPG